MEKDMYPIEIAEFERNSKEVYKITLNEFNGKVLMDIRVWYRNAENQYAPGKKGVSLPADKVDEVIGAFQKIKELTHQ